MTHAFVLNAAAGPCDPATFRNLYEYAKRHWAEAIAKALAANPATPEDVDGELARHTSPAVRAAWLARPGRRYDEVAPLVPGARTGSVIAVLGARKDLSETDYRLLGDRASTQAAAWALMTNEVCPFDVRVDAARVFGHRTKSVPGTWEARLDVFLAGEAELAVAIVDATSSPALLTRFASEMAVGPQRLRRIFDAVVPTTFDETPPRRQALQAVAGLMANRATPDDVRAACSDRLRDVGAYGMVTDVPAVPTEAGPDDLLRLADRLGAAIAQSGSRYTTPPAYRTALRKVAGHRNCPPPALRAALVHLSPERDGPLLWERHVARRSLLAVLGAWSPDVYDDEALARLENPSGLLVEMAKHQADGLGRPGIPDSRFVTDEVLAHTSARVLAGGGDAAARVVSYLTDTFADNPDCWDVFTALVDGFDGTLGDLVATVRAVAC